MEKALKAYRAELILKIRKLLERQKELLDSGDVASRHYLAGQVLAYNSVINKIDDITEKQ